MSSLYRDLLVAYTRLAPRPLPTRWINDQPFLADFATPAHIVAAIRDDSRRTRADDAVRAMVSVARTDPAAATVLLEALAPMLRARMGPTTTQAFRAEVLSDLALVILESDDLDQLRLLPKRLARRAYARARRRIDTERLHQTREWHLTYETPVPADVAEIATDRAHLHAVHQKIQKGIRDGDLTVTAWEDYRDGRLAPAVGGWRIQPSRTRTYRGRQAVDAVLGHAS
jgi:hypothetical protein